ncbi:hypothetical protein EYE40_15250 [Glaciihabitans arcticus]|uniref:DUF4352 domain-containing protein n=1 Tax=Glaciihabitans arcticus TaxID=2668039 RepID=A0A4Q9GMG5_9MICO|nr:hypothetical protein [Glaciihabitans arcticus]TBN55553.1 hypothetical protein EYE40_15250 [Glaciihabitans arcticus]
MISTPRSTRLLLPLLASVALVASLAACSFPARGVSTVPIGETVEIPMSADGSLKYNMSVDELQPLGADDVSAFGLKEPDGSTTAFEGHDVYLVRFTVTSATDLEVKDSSFVPNKWALISDSDDEFRGIISSINDEADCEDYRDSGPSGCQVVAVPEGTEITMVRYMGVDDGPNRGSSVGAEQWAGWTIP